MSDSNESDNDVYDDVYSSSDDDDAETPNTKSEIVLCELYNQKIHGTPPSTSKVNGHYLVISKFKSIDVPDLLETAQFYNRTYKKRVNGITPHDTIRNYKNIVTLPFYVKPEIAKCLRLTSGEYVCILKTHWLRLVQRNWKRVYLKRHEKCNSSPTMILEPSLRGMFYAR